MAGLSFWCIPPIRNLRRLARISHGKRDGATVRLSHPFDLAFAAPGVSALARHFFDHVTGLGSPCGSLSNCGGGSLLGSSLNDTFTIAAVSN